MMIDPPIDKLVDKLDCKYALVCLLTKRARFLLDKKQEFLKETGGNAISLAAKEFYNGQIRAAYED